MKAVLIFAFVIALLGVIVVAIDSENQFLGYQSIRLQRPEHPVMNLPAFMRQHNWASRGEGSCVVASTISLLRWQGEPEAAKRLLKYGGGQYFSSWNAILNAEDIKYSCTNKKYNIAFLERSITTRRGCMTTVDGGRHMVCLVDLTPRYACILDNNSPEKYIWLDREAFLHTWQNAGSWALTPVYTPTSPRVP